MRFFSKHTGLVSICMIYVIFYVAISQPEDDWQERILIAFHSYMEKHCREMLSALADFKTKIPSTDKFDSVKAAALKASFRALRKDYKKIEAFSCYYFPASERNFNG